MICKYCGKTEICNGSYPEGCFLENEKLSINHKALLRELMVRGKFMFPQTEEEERWFEEGTDLKKCPDFLKRLLDAVE